MNIVLFRVHFSHHPCLVSLSKLNRNADVNSTDFSRFVSNLDVQQPTFFDLHGVLLLTEYTPLAYVHTDCFHEANLELFGLRPPQNAKRNCVRICVWLVLLSRRVVNQIYRSLLAVVVHWRPCLGRRRSCPVSWSQVHCLVTILLAALTASAMLVCVCPDSSLWIICQAMDSDASYCHDIFQ